MKFWQVDSFTREIFRGNPAAVFVLSGPLSEKMMMDLAREMNLSETAFLLKEGSRWRLRWFTPNSEVDLCGHATLAAAHVLWEQGFETSTEISFMTRSGELRAEKSPGGIALDFPLQPALRIECLPASHPLLSGQGVEYLGHNGHDLVAVLGSADAVRKFKPDMAAISAIEQRGFLITARSDNSEHDYVYRAFFPKLNIPEDPVTGSANTCLAPLWADRLGKTSLRAAQLSERGGELVATVSGDRVSLLGNAVTVFTGQMRELS